MKCNLDCDYCETGIYGGHDNSQLHPPLSECISAIDFMYEYVDRILKARRSSLKHVVLNVYGGEALNHPDIVNILNEARTRHQQYQDRWNLTITVTTNAIVTTQKIRKISELIDEFTVSWHGNNKEKQKQQFRNNLLEIKKQNRRLKCIVMMHPNFFNDALDQINWCKENNISYLPKQIDHRTPVLEFNYPEQQIIWFKKFYNKQDLLPVIDKNQNADLADTGRSCCGGRSLCVNQNYKQREKFVQNKFPGWSCSVDKFFLFVKQSTQEVFVNKDCKINYNGQIGAIGNLNNTQLMLNQIGSTPVIKCINYQCNCGLCAPKAKDIDTYNQIMKKYLL